MPEPKQYKHIRAWGKMLQSYDYYIEAQQEQAAEDGAPLDATFKGQDGTWRRASEAHPETQKDLEQYL